jgi:hypothetical protein
MARIWGVFRLSRAVDFRTSRISCRISSAEGAARFSGIRREGELRCADRLPHVPLAMFRDVDCQTDGGCPETLTSNFPDLTKLFGRQRLNEFFVAGERVSDGSDQFTGGRVGVALFFDGGELFGAELAAFQISAEPFGAAGEVSDVKTCRRHAMWRGPQLINCQWAYGAIDVFADVVGGPQKMTDDWMDAGNNATYPGFNSGLN